MPWLMQMAGCAMTILFLALAAWIGMWLLLVLAALSLGVALWRYLVAKGIVNPRPGQPINTDSEETTITVIEGEFEHVEEKKDQHPKGE